MSKKDKYNVTVVGALGIVGTEMIKTLERRNFPVASFVPMDVKAKEGEKVKFNGKDYACVEANKKNFQGLDIAIFSAGGEASRVLAPIAAKEGVVVVDNSAQWRMDPDCPLVVPEVNPYDLDWHKNIIANPNCSTIQLMVVLKPLHDYAKIKRVVVSTYQSVSGSGIKAFKGLEQESREYLQNKKIVKPLAYSKQIAFNCLAHIDVFQEGGYTKEEWKMVNETKKILNKDIKTSATCVRVPVWYGHSESVNIETEKEISVLKAREILAATESVQVMDDPDREIYPTPLMTIDEDDTFVGRIRKDPSIEKGLNLWVVSNNIRKGAALNSVQIAETLLKRNLI